MLVTPFPILGGGTASRTARGGTGPPFGLARRVPCLEKLPDGLIRIAKSREESVFLLRGFCPERIEEVPGCSLRFQLSKTDPPPLRVDTMLVLRSEVISQSSKGVFFIHTF